NSQSSGGENGENDKSQDGDKGNKSDKNAPKDLSQAGENVDGQEADDAANGGRGGIRTVKVEIVYNGKKITGTINQDLASNNDMAQEGAAEKSLSESKEALEKIRIKTDDGKSKDPSFNMGLGSAFIDRQIEFALSVRYNWRQILKKVLNTDARFRGTYLKPNSGYMQQGVTLPTRQNFGKPTSIKGLKLCIDVSGSIGDNELKKIFGEIEGIIRACDGKVDAEVIYWNTTVTACGDFKDKNTFTKIKPKGCGGTDPICAFDYIAGKTRVEGKAQKTKPKDISLVVFFTDGCIPDSYGDYAKMFGNKTLWVIDECMPAFKPLFGRIAVAKLKKQ
ncbi:MAG: VWA-like domain-containing protein, partial [Oscillospiraceae bacterium]|nr:VWA-like domain-containing protein [Oscillospiraceae bacterium]